MLNKAIEHITKQMMEEQDDLFIVQIEEYLVDSCTTLDVAEKLMNPDKSLAECRKEIRKEVEKQAKEGCAVVRSTEVFKLVDSYYGITSDSDSSSSIKNQKSNNVVDVLDLL